MSDLAAIEARVQNTVGAAESSWIVPVLSAIHALGGQAAPTAVERQIHNTYQNSLTAAEWDQVWKVNRVRFVRFRLVKTELIENGEYGVWRITDDGLTYLACVAHVDWHCAANRRFVPTTCCFRRSMRLRSTRGLRRCRA
jgi:hypothetical protein